MSNIVFNMILNYFKAIELYEMRHVAMTSEHYLEQQTLKSIVYIYIPKN